MCADTSLHTNQAGWHIGQARLHLATRPLLAQHDRASIIVAYDMERVLADIDADDGNGGLGGLGHGALLVVGAPCQLLALARQEHGRTIPLADKSEIRLEIVCPLMTILLFDGCAVVAKLRLFAPCLVIRDGTRGIRKAIVHPPSGTHLSGISACETDLAA